jgi:hypothetical protein
MAEEESLSRRILHVDMDAFFAAQGGTSAVELQRTLLLDIFGKTYKTFIRDSAE